MVMGTRGVTLLGIGLSLLFKALEERPLPDSILPPIEHEQLEDRLADPRVRAGEGGAHLAGGWPSRARLS